jgi:hypothetical protein
MKVTEFLPEIFESVKQQLESDYERWGDTWLTRTREGQEDRIFKTFNDYYDQYKNAGIPIPWTKVIGNVVIAMIRENHSELFPK